MEINLQRKLDEFVNREVIYSASALVYELSNKGTLNEEELCSLYYGELIEGTEDEPEYEEIFEHWIVSEYLADRLEEKGESITRNFYGFTIWGRSCTGQAISMDYVIGKIYEELHANAI